MNILIISLAYAPYAGVGSARMTSLSGYLVAKGNKVTVLCYDSEAFGVSHAVREVPEGVERIVVNRLFHKRKNQKQMMFILEQLVKKSAFDICISSVGPFETMFFIHKLQTRWKIPYIIDYRDPWLFVKRINKPKGVLKYKVLLHDILCMPVEKRAIKHASGIVLVTEKSKDDLNHMYHIEQKCRVIYNGYEFGPIENSTEKNDGLTIVIAGKFSAYYPDAAKDFLEVCDKINHSNSVRVKHIGESERLLEGEFTDVYQKLGPKSYNDTLKELAGADAFLVCYPYSSGLGTKVFDYIACNKPIIYIGRVPSELSEFINQFENSYVCKDREGMQHAVEELQQKRPSFLTSQDVSQYSRDCQNEIYWKLIKEIVGEK